MNRCQFFVGSFVTLSILAAPLLAQEPTPAAPVGPENSAEAGVERILNVIDLVLEHHIDPPTRQEMLLNGARSLLSEAKLNVPTGLSRRVSDLMNRQERTSFLTKLLDDAQAAGTARGNSETTFTHGVLQIVPGDAVLMSAKELKVQQQLQDNQYVGIGIAASHDEFLRIRDVFPNGPAAKAGAKSGERIDAIDGKSTNGLSLQEAVERLRGPEGSQVTLVLSDKSQNQRTLTITRGIVPRDTVHGRLVKGNQASQDFRAEPDGSIAYVRIAEIGGSSVHELRRLEQRFRGEGMRALIIDLQYLESHEAHYVALLADALLANGRIGQIRHGDHTQEFTADGDCLFADWPLAVLVNESSEGTVEWLAAALQDNQRAIVVGNLTPGEAFVTTSLAIPGSEDTVTIATGILERPSGKPLLRPRSIRKDQARSPIRPGPAPKHLWGVRPDHLVQIPNGDALAAQRAIDERISLATKLLRESLATSERPADQSQSQE